MVFETNKLFFYKNQDFREKLFDSGTELLPSVTELFELEMAFYEYNQLSKKELLERSAFFKTVSFTKTHHFLAYSQTSDGLINQRSSQTRSYFENGQFSTGYATHALFPYRGKFHPQLIKGLINIIGVKKGEYILDPMAGSGTTNIEASLMGINSVAVDVSPFCQLMIETKYESLKTEEQSICRLNEKWEDIFDFFLKPNIFEKVSSISDKTKRVTYLIALLAFLDSMGYSKRVKLSDHRSLFQKVLVRYINTIKDFANNPHFKNTTFGKCYVSKQSTALELYLKDNSIDGVITSPPYSFAIDYVNNDRDQLEFLGCDIENLKKEMIGLKGKNKKERLKNYFIDMENVCREIKRVLKPHRFFIIVIGSNTNQTGGIRLENQIIESCENNGLHLVKSILKPIKGMRNTMRDEFILFFQKR